MVIMTSRRCSYSLAIQMTEARVTLTRASICIPDEIAAVKNKIPKRHQRIVKIVQRKGGLLKIENLVELVAVFIEAIRIRIFQNASVFVDGN